MLTFTQVNTQLALLNAQPSLEKNGFCSLALSCSFIRDQSLHWYKPTSLFCSIDLVSSLVTVYVFMLIWAGCLFFAAEINQSFIWTLNISLYKFNKQGNVDLARLHNTFKVLSVITNGASIWTAVCLLHVTENERWQMTLFSPGPALLLKYSSANRGLSPPAVPTKCNDVSLASV